VAVSYIVAVSFIVAVSYIVVVSYIVAVSFIVAVSYIVAVSFIVAVSYIMAVSFIGGGGNRSTRKKATDLQKVKDTLSHDVVSSTPHHEQDSKSQRYW
jgi:hypothetical protein